MALSPQFQLQGVDPKSTDKGSSSGTKLMRKVELKKSRNGKEDNLVVNNGNTSSKGHQSNNKKKKDLVVGRVGEEALKKSVPSVGSLVSDDEDDDDEENLEANAAMILSSQFNPSCTGLSSNTKSRKRSRKVKNVIKEEDDSCIGSDLDSEPIAVWLARSSERVKYVPKSSKSQRTSDNENLNSIVSDSTRPRNNPDRQSASLNNLNGCVNGKTLVYVRRKKLKKGEVAPLVVTPRAPVTVTAKEDRFLCGFLDSDKQFWSMDNNGRLRLNVALPLLPFKEVSFGTGDFWLLHNMMMLQQGLMVAFSPMVTLEMLFVDTYEGIRFLLFEGCMKKALAFVFSVLIAFIQPDEQWNSDVQVPVTSIRFRLCRVEDVTKYRVFQFHSFSIMVSSKWLQLDSKLLRRCRLVKQLSVSECTPDNIKELSSYAISSDMSWNTNGGFFSSPKSTGPRISKRVRSSSISSPHENNSPVWWRPNGPKRPRTHVQYTVPSSGYEFNGKQKNMQNEKYVPWKRIRRASLKRSNAKKFELLACNAKILITHEDKGWRQCGAHVFLEGADHNEWKLAVKVSGLTKYSYKVKHILQAGTVNRYSHCMMWKGGKDWVLEFPNRSQWTLFKEMYEECRNRNIRAAYMKHIPIPGVTLVEESDDYGNDVPFVRTKQYFRQVQNDVEMAIDPSRVLYDMDSDDERCLMANKSCKRVRISDDLFERIMDLFEKNSYVERRERFSDDEIEDLVFGVGSAEVAKAIYGYWREKREKMGVPLVRHLQPPRWERYEQQLKEWERNSAEKPLILPFCQKPRGLEVPNKVTTRRSHRKLSVNGHHHNNLGFGRRSNTRAIVDDKVSPRDAHFTLEKPMFYRNKSRKISSFQSQRAMTVNRNGDGPHMSVSDLQEFQALKASKAAQRACNMAKHKRERAEKLMVIADLAMQKAAKALMTAEAIKAAHENSNGCTLKIG